MLNYSRSRCDVDWSKIDSILSRFLHYFHDMGNTHVMVSRLISPGRWSGRTLKFECEKIARLDFARDMHRKFCAANEMHVHKPRTSGGHQRGGEGRDGGEVRGPNTWWKIADASSDAYFMRYFATKWKSLSFFSSRSRHIDTSVGQIRGWRSLAFIISKKERER